MTCQPLGFRDTLTASRQKVSRSTKTSVRAKHVEAQMSHPLAQQILQILGTYPQTEGPSVSSLGRIALLTLLIVVSLSIVACAQEVPGEIPTSPTQAVALTPTPEVSFTPTAVPDSMPTPTDTVSTSDLTAVAIQAYLDQECALSRGDPNVAMLPDVGSENAGHTENLCFFLSPGSITEQDVRRHAARIQHELERVSDRLGVEVPQIVRVDFRPPFKVGAQGGCPARGYTQFGTDIIAVLASDETRDRQIYAVAAHEFGHVVSVVHFGNQPPDAILQEGMATWLGAEAWLDWYGFGSMDDAVRAIAEEGAYIPLLESPSPGAADLSQAECWKRRDVTYTQWAGFVWFLIDTYGMDAIEKAWKADVPSSPDPATIYNHYRVFLGLTLEELELQWLESLGIPSR